MRVRSLRRVNASHRERVVMLPLIVDGVQHRMRCDRRQIEQKHHPKAATTPAAIITPVQISLLLPPFVPILTLNPSAVAAVTFRSQFLTHIRPPVQAWPRPPPLTVQRVPPRRVWPLDERERPRRRVRAPATERRHRSKCSVDFDHCWVPRSHRRTSHSRRITRQ